MSSDHDVIRRLRRHYRAQDLVFSLLDAVLAKVLRKKEHGPLTSGRNPERVLIANIGRIGDVIISTAVLPVLKAAFPAVDIAFLTGSWGRPVLENHPLVTRVHYLDHWRLSGNANLYRRATGYRRERSRVIKELQRW